MSDTPVAPTAAPSAPAAPAATPAPAAPHHAHLQPREQGKFAGPPDPTKATPASPSAPEAPKTWKVGQREFKSPEEMALYASEADSERSALDAFRKQAAEAAAKAKEYEERLKDPSKLVTKEMRQQIIQAELREFQKQEYLKTLSPEARELFLIAEEREQRAAALEAQLKQREAADAEAKAKADAEAKAKQEAEEREEIKAYMNEAMKAEGLNPNNPHHYLRMTTLMRGAAERGVLYRPEVIAMKVREQIERERTDTLKSVKANDLLAIDEVVSALNGVEDAAMLRKLAPLIERGRRLHLEALGAAPAAPVAAPSAPTVAPANGLKPGDPGYWDAVFRERAKGG